MVLMNKGLTLNLDAVVKTNLPAVLSAHEKVKQ